MGGIQDWLHALLKRHVRTGADATRMNTNQLFVRNCWITTMVQASPASPARAHGRIRWAQSSPTLAPQLACPLRVEVTVFAKHNIRDACVPRQPRAKVMCFRANGTTFDDGLVCHPLSENDYVICRHVAAVQPYGTRALRHAFPGPLFPDRV